MSKMLEDNLRCRSHYMEVKHNILKSDKNSITDNINDFIKIIDYCDKEYWKYREGWKSNGNYQESPSNYLVSYPGFDNSVKGILKLLCEKYPLEWIDQLFAELFATFEKIQEGNENNLFKLFNYMGELQYIEKLPDEKRQKDVRNLCNLSRHVDSLASEKFLFLIYLFILSVQEINTSTCIEKIISKARDNFTNKTEEEKFLATWIITETLIGSKKIDWKDKRNFFWEWKENPYFSFFNETTFINFELIDNIAKGGFEGESLDKDNPFANHFIYNFLQLVHSFEGKACDEEKNFFREKILKNITLNLQEKTKELLKIINNSFHFSEMSNWLNKNKTESYRFVFASFASADYLNKLLPGVILLKQEEKRIIDETIYLYYFILSFENDRYKLKTSKISKFEQPDFILETENAYKIGLELTRYEKEEEFRERTNDDKFNLPFIDPTNGPYQLIEQLKDKINEKILKCKDYNKTKQNLKLDELWLYLNPSIISRTALNLHVHENLDKNFYKEIVNQIRNSLNNQKDNCFDKIYCLSNNKPILLFTSF
ncbi:hypothetical protein DESAMIL20_274 [Desulfurella amilsii]|uniref:Uncharacterized protein n=1 Tax=Desulfurella amilsii TaxID=1562698 RepID=A0A1X4Y056_9BACT|nr:hypothetical protein [Desulfurella amilsii]OSS43166.1 hypothetical protein DESAMIL20_274 [Desulfurella amilsii]